jgi:hypothetical protein
MSVTQTVEIPVNHRLTIDVPREIPAGKAILSFIPVTDQGPDTAPLPGGPGATAAENAADPNRKPISRFFGILSPETFGDGVAYQRKLRDEWDD